MKITKTLRSTSHIAAKRVRSSHFFLHHPCSTRRTAREAWPESATRSAKAPLIAAAVQPISRRRFFLLPSFLSHWVGKFSAAFRARSGVMLRMKFSAALGCSFLVKKPRKSSRTDQSFITKNRALKFFCLKRKLPALLIYNKSRKNKK